MAKGRPAPGTFAERLRDLRNAHGYTRAVLARVAGVSVSYVSALEAGTEDNPSREVMERLAAAFNIPVANLLDPTQPLASAVEPARQATRELTQYMATQAFTDSLAHLAAHLDWDPIELRRTITTILASLPTRQNHKHTAREYRIAFAVIDALARG